MAYSLENLKRLREVTGIGIKKCMEALVESDNNFEDSLEWLRKYSISLRNASFSFKDEKKIPFGITFIKKDEEKAISFLLGCESDFAEKSDLFISSAQEIGEVLFSNFQKISTSSDTNLEVENLIKEKISSVSLLIREKVSVNSINFFMKEKEEDFGVYLHHNRKLSSLVILENGNKEIAHEIALHVAVKRPLFISRELIPAQTLQLKIDEIKESLDSELKEKKEAIIENIVKGKIEKWYSEVCLLEMEDFRNPGSLVSEIISSHGASVKKIFFEKI